MPIDHVHSMNKNTVLATRRVFVPNPILFSQWPNRLLRAQYIKYVTATQAIVNLQDFVLVLSLGSYS